LGHICPFRGGNFILSQQVFMPINNFKLQVVILAAGKGVRMRSAKPKVLHRVCGISLLERVLRATSELKPVDTTVVVGFEQEKVRSEVEKQKFQVSNLQFVEQKEQNGTGHATQVALKSVKAEATHVLIIPGDVPLITADALKKLVADSVSSKLSLISAVLPDATGFGRIVRDAKNQVERIVEHKDASEKERGIKEFNSGIYLVEKKFLEESLQSLKPNNLQKELYLTDIVSYATSKNIPVTASVTADYHQVLGANSIEELSALETIRRRQIVSQLMADGVTFENPDSVYIDEDVTIGADSFVGAGTRLQGVCEIGEGVRFDGDSLIANCKIGKGSHLKLGCYFESSELAADCSVGPFAHIRPQSQLEEGVKIGNFVEVKKANLKKGVKASHLSYIGDATVGENSNIGAGTIFCNYDGQNKHHSVIEEGVFVGSNSCLVAPVKIGKGAYIGAGSTITKDVAADSLAISRGRQTAIEGWATRNKSKTKK